MRTRTHLLMNRSFFPDIPMPVMRQINHDIDNPTYAMRKISRVFGAAAYDFLDLTKMASHRRSTHNLPMLMLIGYRLYGSKGAKVAIAHAFTDHISDMMRKKYGRKYRDVFETLYDLHYTKD